MTPNAHLPNITSTLVDIHRLLAMFQASENIARLEIEQHMRQLFAEVERDEITRILLSVAVTVRIVEDRQFKSPGILKLLVGPCGTLTEDIDTPSSPVGLELREACNKIVHSLRMDLIRRSLPDGRQALDSHIRIHGKRRNRESVQHWRAELDVVEFCQSAALVLDCLARFEPN